MRDTRDALIVLGIGLLGIGTTGVAGTTGASRVVRPGYGGGTRPARDSVTRVSLPAHSGGRLNAQLLEVGGDLRVTGWAGDSVVVLTRIGPRGCPDGRITVDAESAGVVLRAALRAGASPAHLCAVGFDVYVPTHFDVHGESGGGTLAVEHVTGRLDGRVLGGGVVLRYVNGVAALTVAGGIIRVDHSHLEGSLRSAAGAITLDSVSGGATVTARSGAVFRNGRVERPSTSPD